MEVKCLAATFFFANYLAVKANWNYNKFKTGIGCGITHEIKVLSSLNTNILAPSCAVGALENFPIGQFLPVDTNQSNIVLNPILNNATTTILLKNNTSLTNPTSTTNESIWQCDGCAPNASIPRLNPNGTSTIGEWNCTDSSCQLATPVPGSGLVDGGNCSDDGCNTTRPDSCIPDFDCEFYRHSQYEGLPWKSLANITTPRICQAQCQSHLQFCLSWTLDSSSTCWLFDVIGSLKPLTNSVSGPVSLGCLIPGLEYLGANLATKQNVQRAEDCWKICRGNPRCTHFSMTPSRRSCALKETGVYLRASHYVISGPRDCPN